MNILLLIILSMIVYTPQQNLNDCGPASVLMIAKVENLETPFDEPAAWHFAVTEGEDRALHITELVWMLRDIGVETEYTCSLEDIRSALEGTTSPMIFLDRDNVHFIVLWSGYALDPRAGMFEVTMEDFLKAYTVDPDHGVGLLITDIDRRNYDDQRENNHSHSGSNSPALIGSHRGGLSSD